MRKFKYKLVLWRFEIKVAVWIENEKTELLLKWPSIKCLLITEYNVDECPMSEGTT